MKVKNMIGIDIWGYERFEEEGMDELLKTLDVV